jgi:hypothetical protein
MGGLTFDAVRGAVVRTRNSVLRFAPSRFIGVLGVLAVVAVAAAGPAVAGTSPLPTTLAVPAGAIAVPASGTMTVTTNIGGQQVPVTVVAGPVTEVSPSTLASEGFSVPAASTTFATRCWTENNTIHYGPSWAVLMYFQAHLGWCGNGNKISSEGQQIKGWVTGTGLVTFWVYQGYFDKTDTMYYDYWAYQDYVQGHFAQCPVVRFACFDDKYPTLTENIYANGTHQNYWSY